METAQTEKPGATTEERSPCFKKKAEGGGLLENALDHLDQFKNTSAEKHWICLKKTVRRAGDFVDRKKETIPLFGLAKVRAMREEHVKESAAGSATAEVAQS